ncbi:hypothetical protein N0V94_001455 [Neodidymelliopsis sp. IMI 364377]|nr:hypothetical protein N0V94_001455 [Neodidymelliopsis sp. IMI 364377]
MLPAGQSWSTATAHAQDLQLTSDKPPHEASGSELDGRKRRRIVPLSCTAEVSTEEGPGEWDYLTKWEEVDASLVEEIDGGQYLVDASEGSLDVAEDHNHEADEEQDSQPNLLTTRFNKLSNEKVVEIINECIARYTEAWTPEKDEIRRRQEGLVDTEIPIVRDPLALGEGAESTGRREELAKKHELEAEYYRDRLDKLCDAVANSPADTIDGVKKQCRNLEITVEQLSCAEWLASVYGSLPRNDSDDNSEIELPEASNAAPPLTTQSLDCSTQMPAVEIIDLGTPSDSSDSELDNDRSNKVYATSTQSNNGRDLDIPSHSLVSDFAVADTSETSTPFISTISPAMLHGRAPLGDAPEQASIVTRIVTRAVHDLGSTDRENVRQRLQNVGRASMTREIPICVDMLLKGDTKMPGILPQDLHKILEQPTKWQLEELAECLRQDSPDPGIFCDYVDTTLSTTFNVTALRQVMHPSQPEIIEISDDDEPDPTTVEK